MFLECRRREIVEQARFRVSFDLPVPCLGIERARGSPRARPSPKPSIASTLGKLTHAHGPYGAAALARRRNCDAVANHVDREAALAVQRLIDANQTDLHELSTAAASILS